MFCVVLARTLIDVQELVCSTLMIQAPALIPLRRCFREKRKLYNDSDGNRRLRSKGSMFPTSPHPSCLPISMDRSQVPCSEWCIHSAIICVGERYDSNFDTLGGEPMASLGIDGPSSLSGIFKCVDNGYVTTTRGNTFGQCSPQGLFKGVRYPSKFAAGP